MNRNPYNAVHTENYQNSFSNEYKNEMLCILLCNVNYETAARTEIKIGHTNLYDNN